MATKITPPGSIVPLSTWRPPIEEKPFIQAISCHNTTKSGSTLRPLYILTHDREDTFCWWTKTKSWSSATAAHYIVLTRKNCTQENALSLVNSWWRNSSPLDMTNSRRSRIFEISFFREPSTVLIRTIETKREPLHARLVRADQPLESYVEIKCG